MQELKNRIKKSVILAAGVGVRLSEKFPDVPKPLIKIANFPLIYYPVKNFYDFGIREFAVVVNRRTASVKKQLHKYFPDAGIHLVYQEAPLGTGRALLCAKDFIEDSDFFMSYCDNIGSFKLHELETVFQENNYLGALIITENPSNPDTAQITVGCKTIRKIYEKPKRFLASRKLFPVYIFKSRFFEYLQEVKKSPSGEYDISEAVNLAIRRGEKLGYTVDNSLRVNLNTPNDIEMATKLLNSPNPEE